MLSVDSNLANFPNMIGSCIALHISKTHGGHCLDSWWSLLGLMVVTALTHGGHCSDSWWSLLRLMVVTARTCGGHCSDSWW